jgi:hypothetical protein
MAAKFPDETDSLSTGDSSAQPVQGGGKAYVGRTDGNVQQISQADQGATAPSTGGGGQVPSSPGTTGLSELQGNDAQVSLGGESFDASKTDRGEVYDDGTFMHELGHNLGLHHGGDDSSGSDSSRRPNLGRYGAILASLAILALLGGGVGLEP